MRRKPFARKAAASRVLKSKHESFGNLAAAILQSFDPRAERKAQWPRPFVIELFGTPKAGKTTIKEMLKHFFKRCGWAVSTPTEGAEVVEWSKRREPDYNFQTMEYALSAARDRADDKRFHLVILDRGLCDGLARMELYRAAGKITEGEHEAIEGYLLIPQNRNLFDLHICLVADPETAIRRELARALVKKHGETMNPTTLTELLDAHERLWERLKLGADPKMFWHDSSKENEAETATAILEAVLVAFERRMRALSP